MKESLYKPGERVVINYEILSYDVDTMVRARGMVATVVSVNFSEHDDRFWYKLHFEKNGTINNLDIFSWLEEWLSRVGNPEKIYKQKVIIRYE